MSRGQLIGIGIGFGLAVGLFAGWAIGNTVALTSLANVLKKLQEDRDDADETRKDAEKARKEAEQQLAIAKRGSDQEPAKVHAREQALKQFELLTKCAAIRVDVKKENDKAVYYVGDRRVELEEVQKVLDELVTWDGKPDLVLLHEKDLEGAAASAEDAAKQTKKFRHSYIIPAQ